MTTSTTGLPLPANVADLADRLEDAARTLRRVPSAKNSRPAEMRSNWPDYVRDTNEAYGYQAARGGAIKASAAEIARMDEVLGWIARYWSAAEMRKAAMPEDAGAVAWFRHGAGWQAARLAAWRIERWSRAKPPGGASRESIRTLADRAMRHMLAGLHQRQAEAEPAPAEAADTDLPPVRIEVVLDRVVTQRVAAIRADGTAIVQTRHARAEHKLVPARGMRKG